MGVASAAEVRISAARQDEAGGQADIGAGIGHVPFHSPMRRRPGLHEGVSQDFMTQY